MAEVLIEEDDPRRDDVRALLATHVAFSFAQTPPEDSFALDAEALVDPSITFYSARSDGQLLAVGALKELDETHGELKSMHTAEEARRQGLGRAMLGHLLDVARQRGYRRVSLETGLQDAFVGARALYSSAGFTPCEPFGEYVDSATSFCMTLVLDRTA